MYGRVVSSVLILCVGFLCLDSDVWMATQKFHYQVGDEMKIAFMEGESFSGEIWDLSRNKIEMLEWQGGTASKDLSKSIKTTPGNNLSFKFTQPGTQLIMMRSRASPGNLTNKGFKAFLEEQGLDGDPQLGMRLSSPDSIKLDHVHFAKMIVQVGARIDDNFNKHTGHRIETIPAKNPYLIRTGDYLDCLVLFDGKPLPHTLVKVYNRLNRTTFLQNIYTENDGTIRFPISTKGPWMISTVKMVQSEKPGVEWDVLWGSLIFGVE